MADRARRALPAAFAAALIAIGPASPARAQVPASQRVVVVWIDGTSLDDWTRFGGRAMQAVLARAGVGVVQAAAADGHPTRAAFEVGARSDIRGSGRRPGPSMSEVFAGAGRPIALVGDTIKPGRIRALFPPGTAFAPRARRGYTVADPTLPRGMRSDTDALIEGLVEAAGRAALIVVDLPDASRVDAAHAADPAGRARWMSRTLADLDRVIGAARTAATAQGTLVLLSVPGSRMHNRDGAPLGAMAISGRGVPRGLLTSATTNVPGLVSIVDVAPTLISAGGLEVPTSMAGAGADVRPTSAAPARARDLEREIASAARDHHRTTAVVFGALAAAAALAALMFAMRRGKAPAKRIPRRLRDVPMLVCIAALFAPAALTVLPNERGLAAALGVAAVVRIALGVGGAIRLAALTAVVPALVASFAPALGAASAVGRPVAEVVRSGVGPAALGLAIGAVLLSLGHIHDRGGRTSRRSAAVAVAVIAAVVAATRDVRAIAIAAPALAWMLSADLGLPLRRVMIAVGATATFAAAAWVALIGPDPFLTTAELRSFASDHAAAIDLRAAAVLAPLPLLVVAWRRRDEASRSAFGAPGARAAIGATVIAAAAIAIAYPGGVLAAAWTLIPAAVVATAFLTGALGDRLEG